MMRWVVPMLLVAGLTGCALEPQEGMELKCQFTKCICVVKSASFPIIPGGGTTEVLWRNNGDAYCPEDYVLREDPDN